MDSDLNSLLILSAVLLLVTAIFIRIALRIRKNGGALTTTFFASTYDFYNKDKHKAIEVIAEQKAGKKMEKQKTNLLIEGTIKMKKIVTFSLAMLVCGQYGCKEESVTAPIQQQNLITNSSFENNGNPSIDGWLFWSNISSNFDFSNDVPPSAGNWSVVLSVGDFVGKRLQTKLAAPAGQHIFKLSVWSKSKWSNPRGNPGFIMLALNGAIRKSIVLADSVWKYYEVSDTITSIVGDSLTVTLNAGDAYGIQQTFFDVCRLDIFK